MSDPQAGPQPVNSAAAAAAGAKVDAEGKAKKAAGDYTMATHVSSLMELKKVAPDVYKGIMVGVAQTIIIRMHEQQQHLKESMRRSRQNQG